MLTENDLNKEYLEFDYNGITVSTKSLSSSLEFNLNIPKPTLMPLQFPTLKLQLIRNTSNLYFYSSNTNAPDEPAITFNYLSELNNVEFKEFVVYCLSYFFVHTPEQTIKEIADLLTKAFCLKFGV